MVWKTAVIGAGIMGGRWAKGLSEHYRTDLVSVADIDLDRAQQSAEPFGARAYEDYREMLEQETIDFVYIATPDFAHRDPVVAVAESGVNILVEKPLATNTEDAVAMLEAVKEAGVKAEVNFSNRWNPPFVAAKKALDSGEIGEVVSIYTRLASGIRTPTEHLPWASQSTVAWFLHTHTLDLATWLTGKKAVSVYARGTKKKLIDVGVDTYDVIHAIVHYEGGIHGAFESHWILPTGSPLPVDFKYQVLCTDGALYMDTHDQMVHKLTTERRVHEPTLDWSGARLEAYLNMLEQDQKPVADFEDGVENTRILVALHRSLETGAVQEV